MSDNRSKNTVREAMVAHALEEIDVLMDRVDAATAQSKELVESIPSYFEDASNEVANIIKRGVDADVENAHKRLITVHQQTSESIEVLRRLTAQLSSLSKRIEQNSNTLQQALISGAGAFLGGLLAVLIGLSFFS
jgi:23S rRNA maturation mini-RNase III